MITLGVQVYLWSRRDQNRFLTDGLRPCLARLAAEGDLERFWFDRYDLRGPHLRLLWQCRPHARGDLVADLRAWLEHHGPFDDLDEGTVEERHRACQSRALSDADGRPGMARVGDLEVIAEPLQAHPWGLSGAPSALWRQLCHHALWSLDELEVGRPRSGAEWLAAVDQALDASGRDAAGFWRYCARRDAPALADRLEDGDFLARLIGAANARLLESVWAADDGARRRGAPDPRSWLELALSDAGEGADSWFLLREILHSGMKQLAIPVAQQLPVILFALARRRLSAKLTGRLP